ncbi:MAG: 50S ribosomal protein L3 N(5)-glutamine methyltransferase [Rugosibacter sp.]|nr:50S ribosomal protein L3 N(5)-glutamine methyltransferase [Rugosibacter sp.]MDO9272236.1 50S ribosomal protein L3 N(5)-glutamine methyltransferase [Rugosibacter sp.]
MMTPVDELITLRDWLRWTMSRFSEADLFFGHGTDNAWDEAIWLLLATLKLPQDRLEPFLDARLTRAERLAVWNALQQRIARRLPTAYIVQEAWLGNFRFYVDECVIVPRSYFAELLEDGLAPWVDNPEKITSALDLCTGSGCLAILMAHTFPQAQIDAVDLSPEALAVARRNIADYGLPDKVQAIESDLFAAIPGKRYDFILSNPPYVTAAAMAALPAEYRHEPALALAAGHDGLDVVRRILREAANHLNPDGFIAIEVGHNREQVETAFPDLSAIWLDTASSSEKIFLVSHETLCEYASIHGTTH